MTKTIHAVFDGQNLKPTQPLDLERDARYRISIELTPDAAGTDNAWDALEALTGSIEAPEDWAREHDHYLYGTPRREP